MYIFEKAFQIATTVVNNIEGRAADGGASLPYLISMAIAAGPGDHCEIGTLFGASALSVALRSGRTISAAQGFAERVVPSRNTAPSKSTIN